jgi:tetratricopeptide (TPR) repeat protein
MAKKQGKEEPIIDVNEVYSKTEQFVDKNRSQLTYGISAVALLFLAGFGYQYLVVIPSAQKAEAAAWQAENYFEMDSLDLAEYGDGFADGLYEIMSTSEGTKPGMRAAYRVGLLKRNAGDFEGAIEAFGAADFGDDVIGTLATGNMGDCHVELGNYSEAIAYFEDAIDQAESGLAADILAPMFLYKSALAKLESGNASGARADLTNIEENYAGSQAFKVARALAATLANS